MKSTIPVLIIMCLIIPAAVYAQKAGINIIHQQEVYKSIDTFSLKIDIFYDRRSLAEKNNTAIVFFHGGGWAYGSPSEFFTTCERYAERGIIAFSVEYRLSIDHGRVPHNTISPIECVMDARSAIRWVRANAEKYGIDRNKIIAAGQSAGGHLALCTVMINGYDEKTDDKSVSCRPDALLLFSSCVNAIEGWCDMLLAGRRTEIWSISPFHNIKQGLPPMIEFHGTYDDQVPVWTVQFFAERMQKAGNYFELHQYKGMRHYLGEGNPKYSRYYTDEILDLTDEFLRKYEFLK